MGDDVIIVVESSSTGLRGEPCVPQVLLIGGEEVVVTPIDVLKPADHGEISFQEAMQCLHNALIRTHHITSRKKVAKLKQAATFHDVYVLLRYGGAPGVMYVEGKEAGVNRWVSDVQNLRYKDYQLVSRTAPVHRERTPDAEQMKRSGLFESDTVKDFGSQMQQRGVYAWWRDAMGFTGSYDKI